MMCTSFDDLYREPDIPASIFLLLSEKDLCQAELVCTSWRRIIIDGRVWQMKLKKYFDGEAEWNIVLKQHDWLPGVMLDHEELKALLFKIKSFIGPSQMTDNILRYITDDVDLRRPVSRCTSGFYQNGIGICTCKCERSCKNRTGWNYKSRNWQQPATCYAPKQYSCFLAYCVNDIVTWEEKLFLRRRHHDHVTITSNIPPHSKGRRAATRRNPDGSRIRETNLDNHGQRYSNLILFSPTAFPILVASVGNVAVAGARYGKG